MNIILGSLGFKICDHELDVDDPALRPEFRQFIRRLVARSLGITLSKAIFVHRHIKQHNPDEWLYAIATIYESEKLSVRATLDGDVGDLNGPLPAYEVSFYYHANGNMAQGSIFFYTGKASKVRGIDIAGSAPVDAVKARAQQLSVDAILTGYRE